MARERNDAEERLFRIDRMLEHLQKQRDELGEVVEQSRNRRDKNPDGRFPMPHGDAGRGLGEL